jgi:glycolate oxidase FAD binding subunit
LKTHDILAALQEQVRAAAAGGGRLHVRGGGSKSWLAPASRGDALDLRELRGIVSYEPTELVVSVRAGTPLAELEAALAERGQCLPFEPPRFARHDAQATVGGMVAAGLSGPGRLGAGPVRDYVLGASLLSGRGELLAFGGQVMKNVAGYDVSRLLVGSLGTLGAIVEVSLKVMPHTPAEATLRFEMSKERAIEQVNAWCAQPLPISASAWWRDDSGHDVLRLRLRGAAAAVDAAQRRLGGEVLDPAAAQQLWQDLREQTHPWFAPTWAQPGAAGETLWRLVVPPTTPPLKLQGELLLEWGGAQRWLRTALPAAVMHEAAAAAGGHALRLRSSDAGEPALPAPSPALERLHARVKQSFDPHGVFPSLFSSH